MQKICKKYAEIMQSLKNCDAKHMHALKKYLNKNQENHNQTKSLVILFKFSQIQIKINKTIQ